MITSDKPALTVQETVKKCGKCKEVKTLAEFGKDKHKKDGLNCYCKVCWVEKQRKCREANPDDGKAKATARKKLRETEMAWEKAYPDRDRQHKRIYYENNIAKSMWKSAKSRAKDKGLPFDLHPSDIHIPDVCPIFDKPLVLGSGAPGPWSPSLDRIIPELGYVKGNVWVISQKANTMKSNASLKELERLCERLKEILTIEEIFA